MTAAEAAKYELRYMPYTVFRKRNATAYTDSSEHSSHAAARAAALLHIDYFASRSLISLSASSGSVVEITTFEVSSTVVGWLVIVTQQC